MPCPVSHIHAAWTCMCAKGAENHRVSSTHFIPVAQETAAIKIFVPRSYLLYTGAFNLPFFSLPSDFFAPASNLRLQCSGSVCASISPLKSSGNRSQMQTYLSRKRPINRFLCPAIYSGKGINDLTTKLSPTRSLDGGNFTALGFVPITPALLLQTVPTSFCLEFLGFLRKD